MGRRKALLIIAWLIGGCAMTPPLPPECAGKLSPINSDSRAAQHEAKSEARP